MAGDKRKLHDRDAEVISPRTDLGELRAQGHPSAAAGQALQLSLVTFVATASSRCAKDLGWASTRTCCNTSSWSAEPTADPQQAAPCRVPC